MLFFLKIIFACKQNLNGFPKGDLVGVDPVEERQADLLPQVDPVQGLNRSQGAHAPRVTS